MKIRKAKARLKQLILKEKRKSIITIKSIRKTLLKAKGEDCMPDLYGKHKAYLMWLFTLNAYYDEINEHSKGDSIFYYKVFKGEL